MNNSILAGRWRLDDNGSTTVEDSSGNGNNGQLMPLAPVPDTGQVWTGQEPTWAASNNDDTGACLKVNNGCAVVTRPPVPANAWALEPQHITVEACFRAGPEGPGAYAYLVSKGANGGKAASYALYTSSIGTLNFYVTVGGAAQTSAIVLDPKQLWDGKWHVAAGSFDGISIRLFLDGEEVGPASKLPSNGLIDYDLPTHNDFYIGAYNPDGFSSFSGGFMGEIAEVRVWNQAILK